MKIDLCARSPQQQQQQQQQHQQQQNMFCALSGWENTNQEQYGSDQYSCCCCCCWDFSLFEPFFGLLRVPPEAVIKRKWKDKSHISISKCIFLLLVECSYDLRPILTFFGIYRYLTFLAPFFGHFGPLQDLFWSLYQQMINISAFLKPYSYFLINVDRIWYPYWHTME